MSKTTKALAIMGVVAGLGVAALPMSSYAAEGASPQSTDMGVKTTIEDYIAIETTTDGSDDTDPKNVLVEGVVNNGALKDGTGVFNVKTNNKKGYYVQIKAADTTLKNADNDTIPAGVPAKGTSAWGYKASVAEAATNVSIETAAQNYAAVTDSNVTIAKGAAATGNAGDDINLTFGISASASQAAGTYTGKVTLTATTDATAAPAA